MRRLGVGTSFPRTLDRFATGHAELPSGGMQQIAEAMADPIRDRIEFDRRVDSLEIGRASCSTTARARGRTRRPGASMGCHGDAARGRISGIVGRLERNHGSAFQDAFLWLARAVDPSQWKRLRRSQSGVQSKQRRPRLCRGWMAVDAGESQAGSSASHWA